MSDKRKPPRVAQDFIEIAATVEGKQVKVRMIGVTVDRILIHKLPTADNSVVVESEFYRPPADDIDFNNPGWQISDKATGKSICSNDWTPFYEAVSTALELLPIFQAAPGVDTLAFQAWLTAHSEQIREIAKRYIDW